MLFYSHSSVTEFARISPLDPKALYDIARRRIAAACKSAFLAVWTTSSPSVYVGTVKVLPPPLSIPIKGTSYLSPSVVAAINRVAFDTCTYNSTTLCALRVLLHLPVSSDYTTHQAQHRFQHRSPLGHRNFLRISKL